MDQNTQNQTQNQSQSFDDIQKTIALTLGISDLPDEKQKEIIDSSTEVLLKKIFLTTVEKLNEQDQKAYLEMLEKEPKPEEVEKFLTEKIPDYHNLIQAEVDEFIKGMKEAAGAKGE